ncbi:hypothetical protein LSH36_164g06065 [Paralvinella palmiformis]|uniref:S-adenosylmethionine decarboxylase proenzyme n=1 Tax=Paralvinella palmiformis TaxID=53620 RepID=A0AAD9N6D8_9ANNE|nr:hypothetical protein LSH36_164g06065 [Paralvinella palmiformis]
MCSIPGRTSSAQSCSMPYIRTLKLRPRIWMTFLVMAPLMPWAVLTETVVQLLMQDLDPEKMKLFSRDNCASVEIATKKSGIADLIPGTMIDDYLFDPCGYSMNGLLRNGQYFTIHITPEPQFSYCSFETNIPKESYHSLIMKVLDIFKPKKFLVTLFANEGSVANVKHIECEDFSALTNYRQVDHQFCQLKNYNLTYTMFKSAATNTWLASDPPH